MRVAVAVAVLCRLAFAPAIARADDVAKAEQAFNQGLAEMLVGRYDVACPLLAESHRLDPAAGALFTLAECESRWGKVTSAFIHFEQYLQAYARMTEEQRAEQGDRDRLAREQQTGLTLRAAHLTLVQPGETPPEAQVRDNGALLGTSSLGVPLTVDPGEHVITVEAPGRRTFERRFTLAPGANERIELALGEPVAKAVEPDAPRATPPARDEGASAQTVAAYATGGLGLAGLMVGAIAGAAALSEKDTVNEHCPELTCDAEGLEAVDDGRRLALVSTIGFAVGAAGVASSVVLLLTEPDDADGAAALAVMPGRDGTGASLVVRW
jgi:hypothetical protein